MGNYVKKLTTPSRVLITILTTSHERFAPGEALQSCRGLRLQLEALIMQNNSREWAEKEWKHKTMLYYAIYYIRLQKTIPCYTLLYYTVLCSTVMSALNGCFNFT